MGARELNEPPLTPVPRLWAINVTTERTAWTVLGADTRAGPGSSR